MAFTIDYQGDADFLLGNVLKMLATDTIGGDWYVEIEQFGTTDTVVGRVSDVDTEHGQLGEHVTHVILDEVDEDFIPLPEGKTFTVKVENITRLVIP